MVMARLTPRISRSIVSRRGWLLERPPALVESVKLLDSLSRFIAWQRSLADPLEQGENPGHVSGEGSSLFAVGRQTRGQKDTLGGHIVWNLYGVCMELVWNLYGATRQQHRAAAVPPTREGSDVLVVAEEPQHRLLASGLDGLLQPPPLARGHGRESAGEGNVAVDMLQSGHADARQADGQGQRIRQQLLDRQS